VTELISSLELTDVLVIILLLETIAVVILACIIAHLMGVNDNRVARIEIIPTKECR
jgi:hypothetical protein